MLVNVLKFLSEERQFGHDRRLLNTQRYAFETKEQKYKKNQTTKL